MSTATTSMSEYVLPDLGPALQHQQMFDLELAHVRNPGSGLRRPGSDVVSLGSDAELADRLRRVAELLTQVRAHSRQLREVVLSLSAPSSVRPRTLERSGPPAPAVPAIGLRLVEGLLRGEVEAARRLGIQLHIDAASRLHGLPARLDEPAVVSILENLLRNAFDAVGAAPSDRRRVHVLVTDAQDRLRVRVRDWGCGIASDSCRSVVLAGFTTKPGHTGLGLAVITALVGRAGGSLLITRLATGAVFDVVVPYG